VSVRDPFLCALANVDEIADDAAKAVAEEAESFLRAGGVLDAATWGSLHAVTRGAFIVAQRKIDAERAQAAGDAVLAALLAYYGSKSIEALL
jgi:hypothetical protein